MLKTLLVVCAVLKLNLLCAPVRSSERIGLIRSPRLVYGRRTINREGELVGLNQRKFFFSERIRSFLLA